MPRKFGSVAQLHPVVAVSFDACGDYVLGVREPDLADQVSVGCFVAAWDEPLHILVNNAGIMALPQLQRSVEGWEMQFATNFMGHFALTVGLHDALAAARRRRRWMNGRADRSDLVRWRSCAGPAPRGEPPTSRQAGKAGRPLNWPGNSP